MTDQLKNSAGVPATALSVVAGSTLRRARKKHLRPLAEMRFCDIENHIESLTLSQLRALDRAMESCTSTNCWWAEMRIAGFYRSRVVYRIHAKEQKRYESNIADETRPSNKGQSPER